MCVAFWTFAHPGYKLVLAANRDEFLSRPARPAEWHSFGSAISANAADSGPSSSSAASDPWVLSGVDLGNPEHGTWLGMTRDLRIGVLTNIRPPDGPPASTVKQPRSRGGLLKRFLAPPPESAPSVSEEVDALRPGADDYDGFNLLLIRLKKRNDSAWAAPEASILFNRPQAAVHKVDTGPGYHGLSNSPPDQPWPKVNKGKQRMERELADSLAQRETDEQLAERMVDLLSQSIPLDSLRDAQDCTCIAPLRLEPRSPTRSLEYGGTEHWYGTRLSTVILVHDDGSVLFIERDRAVLTPDGEISIPGTRPERRFRFQASG